VTQQVYTEKQITDAYMNIALYVLLFIVVVGYWFKLFRTDDLVDYQEDRLRFFINELRGKHVINKMVSEPEELLKALSIVGMHDSTSGEGDTRIPRGIIIEFAQYIPFSQKLKIFLKLENKKYNEFGVLIETFPPRLSDEFREFHERALEKVVNGLPVNTLYENISCSVLEPKRDVLEYLLSQMQTSKGKTSDAHLADIYLKIAQDEEPTIKWRYYSFISLGRHKTVESARIQYGAIVPGLLTSMRMASLNPVVLRDRQSVIYAYQIMIGETGV